jgi:glycosyltransferase involved in cell wall biosynthesis
MRDPVRRAALGRAGRERARGVFSAEAIVPRYVALYRRVMQGR